MRSPSLFHSGDVTMPKLKVLYFIQTIKPTNYDRQAASYIEAAVSFRNFNHVKPDSAVEACDAVMGVAIPSQYHDKPNLSA
jgi:hypothetical protein